MMKIFKEDKTPGKVIETNNLNRKLNKINKFSRIKTKTEKLNKRSKISSNLNNNRALRIDGKIKETKNLLGTTIKR